MIVYAWKDFSKEVLSDESLRKIFQYPEGYRHFPNRYEAGIKLSENSSRKGLIFIIEGSTFVSSGEYIELPAGRHELETPPHSEVKLQKIYRIPELNQNEAT